MNRPQSNHAPHRIPIWNFGYPNGGKSTQPSGWHASVFLRAYPGVHRPFGYLLSPTRRGGEDKGEGAFGVLFFIAPELTWHRMNRVAPAS